MTKSCLVWLPHSYAARGPAESCIRIIEHFQSAGLQPTVFVNRARVAPPATIEVREATPGPLRLLPYRLVAAASTRLLARMFRRAIDTAPPGTIAYFWPDVPAGLVAYAKQRGLLCVRELINNPLFRAKPVLDAAYRDAGLEPAHGITEAMVTSENRELALHDYVFSSNDEVDAALLEFGFANDRILSSSFGWKKARFSLRGNPDGERDDDGFKVVFVGLINVRKGIPTLLEAWERAGIDGELLLAGVVEECLQPMVDAACEDGKVRHLGHVQDIEALYRSCDLFVFPTHEEGGPQVTYEAAACDLPIITTPMGAARLVKDGRTGLLVPAGDSEALAGAMRRLADDAGLRADLAENARRDTAAFEFAVVGRDRARKLLDLI